MEHPHPGGTGTGPAAGKAASWAARAALPAVIALAVLACYARAPLAPLLLDDAGPFQVVSRWSFPPSWAELARSPLANRPLAALTLSATNALFGTGLAAHHLFNVLAHIGAALCLLGLMNRTLALPAFRGLSPGRKRWLAFFVALTWAVHPLQTQAVTYLIQRGEVMMGLFLLGGLYAAVRSWTSAAPGRWQAASLACLVLGAMSKESIAVLPLVILLHFQIFMEPGLPAFWRRNRVVILGTLALALASAMLLARHLESFYGVSLPFGPLDYALNQGKVILRYLSLSLWPGPLCFDAMWPVEDFSRAAPQAAAVLLMLGGAVWLAVRRNPLGFFAGFFFLTLAPTSSFLPIRDLYVEHRMYLPLAGVIGFAGLAVNGLLEWFAGRGAGLGGAAVPSGGTDTAPGGLDGGSPSEAAAAPSGLSRAEAAVLALAVLAVLALGVRTFLRNEDYAAGEQHLWRDVLAKSPDNPRAHWIVGRYLAFHGQPGEAIAHLSRSFRSSGLMTAPDLASVGDLLAGLLFNTGRRDEALAVYQRSMELDPANVFCRLGYGQCLLSLGRFEEAAGVFRAALSIRPGLAHAFYYLAQAEAGLGRLEEAARDMRASLAGTPLESGLSAPRMPDRAESLFHLGRFLAASGRRGEARAALAEALGNGPSPALRGRIGELSSALAAGTP